MASISRQVTLARAILDCRCHVCAFFARPQEGYEVLLPFLAEGLNSGDRAVQFIDRHDRPDRMRMLIESGIDADAAEQDGRLTIMEWEKAYMRGGRFDQHAMLDLADQIGSTVTDGTVTRIWAEMGWAARELPGVRDVAEYESRLNRVLPKYDMAVVCAYDINNFSGALLWDVLRAHPHVIIGGVLAKNPFYVPPDAFLREIENRK